MRKRVVWYRVLALLVLVMVTAAATTAGFLYYRGIDPRDFARSVWDLIRSEPTPGLDDPAGNKLISIVNAEYCYVKNRLEGYLLVLTGRVRNEYPADRKFIRIKGRLEDESGRVLIEKSVYVGLILSKEELETLSMPRITDFLIQRNVQSSLPPVQNLPFMIVFDNIPDQMYRFTIEPVGSFPAKISTEQQLPPSADE